MQHMTFAELLANKRGEPGVKFMDNGTDFGSKLHVANALQLLKNPKQRPCADGYAMAKAKLTKITGLAFTDSQTKMLLDLYPVVRIHLANTRDIPGPHFSTLILDGLQFAAAHFFLMCSWPSALEPREQLDAFKALLIKQAVAIGFSKVQRPYEQVMGVAAQESRSCDDIDIHAT